MIYAVIHIVRHMKQPNCPEPPYHQIVISSLPAEVLDQIDHLARSTDRSRAAMSRVLLVTGLSAYETTAPEARLIVAPSVKG